MKKYLLFFLFIPSRIFSEESSLRNYLIISLENQSGPYRYILSRLLEKERKRAILKAILDRD